MLTFAACLLAAGCGDDDPAFTMKIDGELQEFDRRDVQGTFHSLELCGHVEPGDIDADVHTCLRFELDPDRMLDVEPGDVLTIDGVATVPYDGMYWYGQPRLEPGADHSPAVLSVHVERSCYCSNYGDHTQTFSGRLVAERVDGDHIELSLSLTMQGSIPAGFIEPVELEVEAARLLLTRAVP